MNTDEIRTALRELIDGLADYAEGEADQIAMIAAEQVHKIARSGGTPEMIETARNVVAHKVAQAAVRASAEAQARITNIAVIAIRLLVGRVA